MTPFSRWVSPCVDGVAAGTLLARFGSPWKRTGKMQATPVGRWGPAGVVAALPCRLARCGPGRWLFLVAELLVAVVARLVRGVEALLRGRQVLRAEDQLGPSPDEALGVNSRQRRRCLSRMARRLILKFLRTSHEARQSAND
jgi:hypothetical protein